MKDTRIFEIMDLSSYFNNDGISWDNNPSDGDFDGSGLTFPAEELPESNAIVTLHDIDFLFPDKSDGAKNNLTLDGQCIAVPPNHYADINILGAADSNWGGLGFQEKVILEYADEHRETVLLGLTSWFKHSGLLFGEREVILCTGYHGHTFSVHSSRENIDCGIWLQTISGNPQRMLKTIQLADSPLMHIFAITLRLAY